MEGRRATARVRLLGRRPGSARLECSVGVVARGVARFPSLKTEMYGCKYAGDRGSVRSREFGSVHSSEVQMY